MHRQSRELEARRRRLAAETGRQRAAAARPLQIITTESETESLSEVDVTGLGRLADLPNEVIMIVFNNCSLRSLLRLERVNKAAKTFVNLLQDIEYIKATAKGIIQRAVPHYRNFMFTILKITTYHGLRYLLTTFTCETCGKPGSFRMIKVKVLCEDCHCPRKQ
ncbi:putative f-box domain containing protein [Daldinia childiae]|uniref:putative f-box domain containing protein n=1 Tax=Daldinia childiae TaxID=326645 RepID=UPI001447FFDF|nr:putative f-box domain containing protein [Daldinia childiae]KAF3070738.1 putative f-box domain containing protein [Daldinia childiae]